MRKTYKLKRKSCSMCKPHKMGWANRWKRKDYVRLLVDTKEIEETLKIPPDMEIEDDEDE